MLQRVRDSLVAKSILLLAFLLSGCKSGEAPPTKVLYVIEVGKDTASMTAKYVDGTLVVTTGSLSWYDAEGKYHEMKLTSDQIVKTGG